MSEFGSVVEILCVYGKCSCRKNHDFTVIEGGSSWRKVVSLFGVAGTRLGNRGDAFGEEGAPSHGSRCGAQFRGPSAPHPSRPIEPGHSALRDETRPNYSEFKSNVNSVFILDCSLNARQLKIFKMALHVFERALPLALTVFCGVIGG